MLENHPHIFLVHEQRTTVLYRRLSCDIRSYITIILQPSYY